MKFTGHNAAVIVGIVIIILFACILGAGAHSWYPAECCNGQEDGGDCRPVPSTSLVPVAGETGCWIYGPTATKFCGNEVRSSPDGLYHVCISDNGYGHCAFIPPGT
jgi:hypothetical protein